MPLRKMRSRSLAVVELVLSLSVSRAWCIATNTHTGKKKEKKENTEQNKVYFNPLPSLFDSYPWEIDWADHLRERKRGREWRRENNFTAVPTILLEEEEEMQAASHPFPSNFTSVTHPPLKSVRSDNIFLPQLPTSSLLHTFLHTYTNIR